MSTPTTTKTQEEIEAFLAINDINFSPIDGNQSVKNNVLLLWTNFQSLKIYLKQLLEFVKNLYLILDVNVIVGNVMDSLTTAKPIINLSSAQTSGTITTQSFGTINTKTYAIFRSDANNFIITDENNLEWDTQKLIVQVKTAVDWQIVYPTIRTIDNAIKVTFHNSVNDTDESYKLIFI